MDQLKDKIEEEADRADDAEQEAKVPITISLVRQCKFSMEFNENK